MREVEVEYSVRDGQPIAESDAQRDELMHYAIDVLRRHFEGTPAYVSGNNFVYYREGDPRAVVSPDCYLVRGVSGRSRDTFKVWLEGDRRPCFVLEISSRSTRLHDLGDKMARYRDDLGVAEYFLFDLRGEWIPERLRGFRLHDGVYQSLERDAEGRLESEQLGLLLGTVDGHLRFYRSGSAKPLPTQAELTEQERARVEQERARAEQERARAEQERARAEQECARAERAEAELARLRAELERRASE